MVKTERPIGIFDSGIGGLTVFEAVRKRLPSESLVYLGDNARVPYGTKSAETVVRYSLENAAFLESRGVKAIVVACNTASALALPALSQKFDIPVLGVVNPGAKEAMAASKKRTIGVIGTSATIASDAYARALKELDGNVRVVSQACPLFVPLVEEGWTDNDVARAAAKHYLSDMHREGIDVLILGCTHYPLLKGLISEVVGNEITLIDSAEATASALEALIEREGTRNRSQTRATYQIYVTDIPARFETVARRFLHDDLPSVRHVSL